MSRTPEQLTQDAWKAIDEVTSTGKVTLPSGEIVVPDPKALLDIFKWLAQFQGKPRKTPKAMDDWKPAETRG